MFTCAVLGAGTMGGQIALSLALGGAHVTLWGRRQESLAPAYEACGAGFDFLVEKGLTHAAKRDEVLGRIATTSELEAAVS